jgi:hypothetical protein
MLDIPARILAPIDLQEQAEKLERQARELERFLAQHDFDGSEDARARLVEGRHHLRWAAGDFERAQAQYQEAEVDA